MKPRDRQPRLITLLTDFGRSDWFVGAVHGMLARLAPRARVIDLCHAMPPFGVSSAAFILRANYSMFPKGTIHVAVIDPGVGSGRGAAVLCLDGQRFVGPDNGLLGSVLAGGSPRGGAGVVVPTGSSAFALDAERVRRAARLDAVARSATFDGRDLFAPAAALLARRVSVASLGSRLTQLHAGDAWWEIEAGALRARVLWIDRFGNLITGVPASVLQQFALKRGALPRGGRVEQPRSDKRAAGAARGGRSRSRGLRFQAGSVRISGLCRTFSDVAVKKPVAYIGSCATLEVAIREGNAAALTQLAVGDAIVIRPGPQGGTT